MEPLTYILSAGFFALGAVFASFIGVISERIFTGTSWATGRSKCDSCGTFLTYRDLVPVLSWMLSAGRCRTCSARVTSRHALSEATLGLLFVLSYLTLGFSSPLLVFLAALAVLTFIVLYDLRHTIVPPQASTALALISFAFAYLVQGREQLGLTLLVAGVIGLGFFLLFFLSRGRAMGLGDSPVAFSLSLLVGATAAIPGLIFSFWIGAFIGILILVSRPKGHRIGIEVPFVPFLAAGYLLSFFTQWNPFIF